MVEIAAYFESEKNYFQAGVLNARQDFKKTINDLAKDNNIILVYPMPEVGVSVPRVIKNYIMNKNIELFKDGLFTTSYEIYKNRTKTSFELLDSIKGDNVYRVYPHSLFCDTIIKDRCVTHDKDYLFYKSMKRLYICPVNGH